MEVKEGELVAIVGQVGTGKSSLVSAILEKWKHCRKHNDKSMYASVLRSIHTEPKQKNLFDICRLFFNLFCLFFGLFCFRFDFPLV